MLRPDPWFWLAREQMGLSVYIPKDEAVGQASGVDVSGTLYAVEVPACDCPTLHV
jgi:hypothetical protein